jgi:hypothetical protein
VGILKLMPLLFFYHDTQKVPTRYHDKRIRKAKSELSFESANNGLRLGIPEITQPQLLPPRPSISRMPQS